MTLVHSTDQDNGHGYFNCVYLGNGDKYGEHYDWHQIGNNIWILDFLTLAHCKFRVRSWTIRLQKRRKLGHAAFRCMLASTKPFLVLVMMQQHVKSAATFRMQIASPVRPFIFLAIIYTTSFHLILWRHLMAALLQRKDSCNMQRHCGVLMSYVPYTRTTSRSRFRASEGCCWHSCCCCCCCCWWWRMFMLEWNVARLSIELDGIHLKYNRPHSHVGLCVCVCVCVCVRACVRARIRARARVRVCVCV